MVGVVCARRAWSAFLSASLEPCHNLPTQASVLMSPVVGPCLPQIVVPRVVTIPGPSWPCSPWPPSSGIVWLVARFPRPGIAIVCPALARPSRSFLIPARHPYRAPRTRPVNPYSRETPCAHDTARLDQTTLRSSSVTCHVCSSPLEECKEKKFCSHGTCMHGANPGLLALLCGFALNPGVVEPAPTRRPQGWLQMREGKYGRKHANTSNRVPKRSNKSLSFPYFPNELWAAPNRTRLVRIVAPHCLPCVFHLAL